MTASKTLAVFGAGPGLGNSLAEYYGQKGYQVALVARDSAALEERAAKLGKAGITAAAFPFDLTDIAGIPALVHSIEERFGSLDVAVYCPLPSDGSFVAAADLDAATLQSMANIFAFAPIEVSHTLLPGMLARGGGAIVLVGGLGAVFPTPGFSGAAPLMAAARNYTHTLHAELGEKGVFAGTVSIGAMINNSTGMRAATAGGRKLDPRFPIIEPATIADAIWELTTKRDRNEAILPPLPSV